MTEEDAKAWIVARFGAEVGYTLASFITLLRAAAETQNLISRASMDTVWTRHIVDSAQLVALATRDGLWIDIGTGAGFPGIVTAIASRQRTLLVEPRRRRVDFLQHVVDRLGLQNFVDVRQSRIETVDVKAGIISARAVSSVADLLASASSCSDTATQFLLPKGRRAAEEVAQAQKSWHGVFHVERSITDPESLILLASGISRR